MRGHGVRWSMTTYETRVDFDGMLIASKSPHSFGAALERARAYVKANA